MRFIEGTLYSEKGKELKLVKGFKFRFHKCLANGVQRWVCSHKSSCTAFLKLDATGEVSESCVNHNHLAQAEDDIERQRLLTILGTKLGH